MGRGENRSGASEIGREEIRRLFCTARDEGEAWKRRAVVIGTMGFRWKREREGGEVGEGSGGHLSGERSEGDSGRFVKQCKAD